MVSRSLATTLANTGVDSPSIECAFDRRGGSLLRRDTESTYAITYLICVNTILGRYVSELGPRLAQVVKRARRIDTCDDQTLIYYYIYMNFSIIVIFLDNSDNIISI